MDSLSVQVLHRLDALAAKAGVGANALWSLWLATWWRPLLGMCFDLLVAVFVCYVLSLILPRLIREWKEPDNSVIAVGGFWLSGFLVAVGAVALSGLVSRGPDAIAYMINHQLYALDQLRGVLGR